MDKFKTIIFILASILITSCKKGADYNSSTSIKSNEVENNGGYSDGLYCASIIYYYDKTETNSTYTLKVEIENNELVKIFWPNGGWLDNSHFKPPTIFSGETNFKSNEGVEYNVTIIGEDGNCNYSTNAESEDELIEYSEVKKVGKIKGKVIWDNGSCDYVVIYTENAWYIVAQKFSGAYSLTEGDEVRGDIVGFGFEDVYCINKDKEMRLYIDNYYATQSSAKDLIIEKCNLEEN